MTISHHLLSKHEEWRGKLGLLVNEVDGSLVNEGTFAVAGQQSTLLLVVADVGIESYTQQGHHLEVT